MSERDSTLDRTRPATPRASDAAPEPGSAAGESESGRVPLPTEDSTLQVVHGATATARNVAFELRARALEMPTRDAIRVPAGSGWRAISYADLEAESNAIAWGLSERGLRPGDRVCIFVRAGIELISITYALFKLGAVPVLIDPGMGRKSLLSCIARIKPRCLIGIPLVHGLRQLFRRSFRTVELNVTVGPKFGWGGPNLKQLLDRRRGSFPIEPLTGSDEAAILFTSGSTGPAKGVIYSHANFRAQLGALRALYDFRAGEVDVVCFPLFALFDTALGMTSVFPKIDPSRPGRCTPADIVHALRDSRATLTFGSPAIWRRVLPWCLANSIQLPHLKRVLVAGAPVPPSLFEDFHQLLGLDADVHTPYGATESLPVSSIGGRQVEGAIRKRTETGAGTCVGSLAPGIEVKLIRIHDDPIDLWSEKFVVPPGELGEICVRGPVVTRGYKFEPDANRHSKIPVGDDFWHRMGDVGYVDEDGRLWFCGRKSHRIQTEQDLLLPVPTENVYNTHPEVHRSALVGVGFPGEEEPLLIVQPNHKLKGREAQVAQSILQHGLQRGSQLAACDQVRRVLFHPSFPVDVRHNAKIKRGELALWAKQQLRSDNTSSATS